jgi:uncharacterized membrane protein YeaQ/YmgE (transglycosylase-associated protein family)
MLSFLWFVLIGFIAGIIARLLSRGPNEFSRFILTTLLAGAFGPGSAKQSVGTGRTKARDLSQPTVGAIAVLFI